MSKNSVVVYGVEYFKPCTWFLSETGCKFGNDCSYLHVDFCPDCLNKRCKKNCPYPQATPLLNMRNKPIEGVWKVVNGGETFEFAFRTDAMIKDHEDRKQARIREEQAAEAKERAEKIAAIQKANENAVPYVSPPHVIARELTKSMENLVHRTRQADKNPVMLLLLQKEFLGVSNTMNDLIRFMKLHSASMKEILMKQSPEDLKQVPELCKLLSIPIPKDE